MKADQSLLDLVPKEKLETDKAAALVQLGYPAVEPVLPDIITWMQDFNWPVAQVFQPFLASIGLPLEPHIRRVFQTDDDMWKYWMLICIVRDSPDLTKVFLPEIQQFALHPTPGEKAAEVDEVAQKILDSLAD